METSEPIGGPSRLGCEEERLQALKVLSAAGAETDLPMLYLGLGDESWRVRKEAAEIFLSLPRAADLAGEIVELLHSEDNAGLRNTAVEILIALGRNAVPCLLREISCPDHDVRKFVLDILGQIGDAAAVPAMLGALRDEDSNVRSAAAENLGKIGSPEAIPALLDALEVNDLLYRFTLLEALGQIGAPGPVDRLLRFENEPLLRKALFDCLGRIGGPEAIPVLVKGLGDSMRNVREASALALSRLGASHHLEALAACSSLAGSAAAEMTADLLESSRTEIRLAAVRILGWMADGRFAPRLLSLFDSEELREEAAAALVGLGRTAACSLTRLWTDADSRARAYLAYLFGEADCEEGRDLLLEAMSDPDSQLRVLAAQALGRIGTFEALPALIGALGDDEEDVRETAMRALALLSRQYRGQTLEILLPLLEDRSADQRMYAVMVLAGLEGREIDEHLALALKDESPLVRRAAVRALHGRCAGDLLSSLVLSLTDEDTEVRRLAVDILGSSGDPQTRAPLELAMQDEDPWVRAAAVRALGRLGLPEAEPTLLRALTDPVGLVVIAALETLAVREFDRRADLLIKALEHQDEEVVSAALTLLAAEGGSDWIGPVCGRLLNHPHWEVRTNFARILAERLGPAGRTSLEERLLVEGEDLVRQQLQDLLLYMPEGQD